MTNDNDFKVFSLTGYQLMVAIGNLNENWVKDLVSINLLYSSCAWNSLTETPWITFHSIENTETKRKVSAILYSAH